MAVFTHTIQTISHLIMFMSSWQNISHASTLSLQTKYLTFMAMGKVRLQKHFHGNSKKQVNIYMGELTLEIDEIRLAGMSRMSSLVEGFHFTFYHLGDLTA